LTGRVKEDQFLKLCHNKNPQTGELLTQRMKTTRWDSDKMATVANRRIFYDFTFSPPKSVSIQALAANDKRLQDSHNRAVRIAVAELQHFAGTRVHQGREISERLTGNVICATFQHDTSRALDPHLHTHCVMFNATFDVTENRWKALSNYEMLLARKYAENVYYHEYARKLRQCGYEIENTPRGDFEIKGVSRELQSRFSKRHNQIDASIEKLLKQKPELAKGNLKELRSQIAQNERSRKIEGIALPELQRLWDSQLTGDERQSLRKLASQPKKTLQTPSITAQMAIQWAETHLFNRRSVVRETEIWSAALEHGRGFDWSVQDIKAVAGGRDYIRNENIPSKITTREILSCEWDVVCFARNGRGKYAELNPFHKVAPDLMPDQRKAAEHILGSRDFVTLFCGGAGTGKSHTLREIGNGLRAAGHVSYVVAPQRQQVLDLKKSFSETQTVSEFLAKRRMLPGAVVIVDEAGQIGGKQMHYLLSFVKANDGRVILSGDTRQHGAVEASDALRAIERYGGLEAARLTKIRRQNPKAGETKSERKRIKQYRAAVRKAQRGQYAESFDRLDKLGAIVECRTIDEQRERLVIDYLTLAERKKSTVIVSQTWSEIHEINERIRLGLRSKGLIDKTDSTVTALARLDLTDAQKCDQRFYPDNAVIVFNRATGAFAKGETGRLLVASPTNLMIETKNKIQCVPWKLLNRITICQPVEMPLAKGDQLQLKANAVAMDDKELVNGELVTVKAVNPNGRIELKDGRVLPDNYREFVRGYAITSYGSQGKTVEHVLFSDSTVKAATNNQQWLVTISRGTRAVKIFTPNKEQLRENVSRLGDRELAIEFTERDTPQARRMPPPVHKYINGLIQSRRPQVKQTPIEKIDLWKPNLTQRQTQRMSARRI
ncbi:MAG TPA: MobF family relaxase, partial [Verrucomicrobiae bacterium]|nr:MobF family relaxase [Verrucomicrobiae bacterium]